jgi:hypothetical protein
MAVSYLPTDPPVTADEHYFTLDEFYAEQDVPGNYPDSSVEPNRELAEQIIEQACEAAFIPRRRTEQTVAGTNGQIRLQMPHVRELEALTENGVAWTAGQLAGITVSNGYLTGAWWTPGTPVTVTYTHGYDLPPARIRRAAMIATRIWTVRGPVDDRATQLAVEGATVNLATPGVLGALTGIPEVDTTIDAYSHRSYIG